MLFSISPEVKVMEKPNYVAFWPDMITSQIDGLEYDGWMGGWQINEKEDKQI